MGLKISIRGGSLLRRHVYDGIHDEPLASPQIIRVNKLKP